MSGPTRRELRRRVDELTDDLESEETIEVAFRDPCSGELATPDGEPVDPDDQGARQLIVIERTLVMEGERAEAHGIEILGPAGDALESRDVVRVPEDALDKIPEEDRYWRTV